jgi:hypothetical protein
VTLLGNPTAAALPVPEDLLPSYSAWLYLERRSLSWGMCGPDKSVAGQIVPHQKKS